MNKHNYSVDFRLQSSRLASYENWSIPFLDLTKLAPAGFFFTGVCVKCSQCAVEILEWMEKDSPMSDHQRCQPTYESARKLPCGNVPIGVESDTVPILSTPISKDICEWYSDEDFQTEFTNTARLASLGLNKRKNSTHPEYANYESRLKTFNNNWPKSMPQMKEQLADAGFYYTGRGDETLCYHCGGGLKDWEPGDDPWEQHVKWFTKCYYVLMIKGQSFIDEVIGQRVTPLTREETLQANLPNCIERVEQ